MTPLARAPLVGVLLKRLARLRFPWLFVAVVVLAVADLLTPDPIPFLDELTLGAIALLLAAWRKPADADSGRDPALRPPPAP